jgi:hypothetical protein
VPAAELRNVQAVRQDSGASVYFVSAGGKGARLLSGGEIMTWVVTSLDPESAQVFDAREVTFPVPSASGEADGRVERAIESAAAKASRACVRAAE